MNSRKQQLKAFNRLLDIMDNLREKCPWDKKQTFESLRHLTIEETYELTDAILDNDLNEIKNELGDVLLHLVFYAKIGSEKKSFDIGDVANAISEKLISRHPHIYGDVTVKNENEVKENWEKLKLKEGKNSVLEGVPKSLPALIKANRIQDKVSGVGFDWEEPDQVWEKVQEELSELNVEIKKGNELVRRYEPNKGHLKCWCANCGGHLMNDHTNGYGFIDVYGSLIENFTFVPTAHLNYESTIMRMKDGLPKFKDFPSEFGGSGEFLDD